MFERIEATFREILPDADFCSLRLVDERSETVCVRQNVLQPIRSSEDIGAMITVVDSGAMGYAATSDLSPSGLRTAVKRARSWVSRTAGRGLLDFGTVLQPSEQGEYVSAVERSWDTLSLSDKVDLLQTQSRQLKRDDRIVDWVAQLTRVRLESLLLTSTGGRFHQRLDYLLPVLAATANEGADTQRRTLGGYGLGQQGGLEILDTVGFTSEAPRVADQALALLSAPDCPSAQMDLLLAPDQMILQIHESIGHPLELDRILGDERNYAGTSFVTRDMFGTYRYGTDLLNVTFDPTQQNELASYGFDDEGQAAKHEYIIKEGILLRPLGGRTSQTRAGMEGVANGRASGWNRPPIDRMANLNLEPGDSNFEDMVKSVERGVYMETNCSWSIDDSRNKFQFGCEYARLIENGELTDVVRKPNYRGISATFWQSLKAVGNQDGLTVMGTPNCGKGEPNQLARVGHASPPCLFNHVDVFGGV